MSMARTKTRMLDVDVFSILVQLDETIPIDLFEDRTDPSRRLCDGDAYCTDCKFQIR